MRLARARDGGNAQSPACVAEDVLLGGSRGEGVHLSLAAALTVNQTILFPEQISYEK